MIGAEYAQFTSYIPSENMVSDPDKKFLPSYLLPTFHVPQPWTSRTNRAGFEEDFIIVAEFSEIEGPKPVMLIPKNGGGNFDQNTFSVKIMAVDHQTNSVGFSISEDTQVVISEDRDGVYSFVHHFVLYDNEARGFVRPFCMAYVTSERRKIMTFYEELSAQFRKVARFLKYGNRMVFVRDLDRYLSDLDFTKGQLRMKKIPHPESESGEEERRHAEEETYRDLQNIRASMDEVKEILTTLRPLLNDRRVECRFQTLEDRAYHQKLKAETTNVDTLSLEENFFSEGKASATFRCGSFNGAADTTLSLFQGHRTYTPKIVPPNRRKKFDSALRGLHELCSWGAKEGLKKLRCIQEHYKRETMVLELERSESNLLDPPGSLMTCGRCVTSNFLTGISMRGLDMSSSLSTPGSDIMKRWPSSDTLDSFKSVGSFVSLQDEDGDIMSVGSADGHVSFDSQGFQSPSVPASPISSPTKSPFYRLGSSCESESTSSIYHTDEASSTASPSQPPSAPQTPSLASPTQPPSAPQTPSLASPTQPPSSPQTPSLASPTQPPSYPQTPNPASPTQPSAPQTPSLASPTQPPSSPQTPSLASPTQPPSYPQTPNPASPTQPSAPQTPNPASPTQPSAPQTPNPASPTQPSAPQTPSLASPTKPATLQTPNSASPSCPASAPQTTNLAQTPAPTSNPPHTEPTPDTADLSLRLSPTDSVTSPPDQAMDKDQSCVCCDHGHGDSGETVTEGQTASYGQQRMMSRQMSADTSCSECSISPSRYVQYTDKQAEMQCFSALDNTPDLQSANKYMGSSQEDTSGDTVPSTSSGEDTGPTSACSTPPSRKPKAGLYSLGDLMEKLGPGVPGYGIVNVLLSCNNLQHILYSLLIGRTVLVVGSPRLEGEVIRIVTALALFLPDHRRKHPSMIEWLSKPFRLTDLARTKLAGVCRPEKRSLESVVPNVVKKYSSIIDVDRQGILAPKYQGNLLTALISKKKVFNTDTEFVGFIHCWLMELSSKAFIFYHSFCLGTAGIMYDQNLQRQKEQYQSTVRSFIAKLGVTDDDIHIVEYLAEIVKMSEIEPHVRLTQVGGGVARPITLNYLPCQMQPLRF
ncbi:guanine nucleotide exchange protein SMCR8-like isoform X2 [Haliotis rufescens]|uniref:guanine nucleotide exchange protein SMCR8-like isoform X2 n=1 Tax=Haliotis rufescens TaxID=6454 RepID=UPI00201E8C85|nr:guanine nucleotide exchange protein SMCR8-like isoform X2 [Haliotis rufescens]